MLTTDHVADMWLHSWLAWGAVATTCAVLVAASCAPAAPHQRSHLRLVKS